MVDQPLLDAAQWAANFAFWGAVPVFPLLTATFWPWWKSDWGWNIISLDFALGLTALPYMLVLNWQLHGTWLAWTLVLAMSLGFLITAWRMVIIFRTQRQVVPPPQARRPQADTAEWPAA